MKKTDKKRITKKLGKKKGEDRRTWTGGRQMGAEKHV